MGVQKKIAIILGDGIGPEVIGQAIRVLDTITKEFGHEFSYSYGLMGAAAIDQTGDPLPQKTIDLCKESDAVFWQQLRCRRIRTTPFVPKFRSWYWRRQVSKRPLQKKQRLMEPWQALVRA